MLHVKKNKKIKKMKKRISGVSILQLLTTLHSTIYIIRVISDMIRKPKINFIFATDVNIILLHGQGTLPCFYFILWYIFIVDNEMERSGLNDTFSFFLPLEVSVRI